MSEDVGDGHGSLAAATESRVLLAQTTMSKLWPDVRDVLLQSAEYVPRRCPPAKSWPRLRLLTYSPRPAVHTP